ncbi:hypothetical protein Cni_G13760 [Canna indica]|uniref:DDE Tnp4 domain-containing protein n=1 Tax=Canna indica TaxID=4628 RepID=A0AAQ3KAT3_9LILI|nr:hypothetical protein Cni_G13760 [Canna indica]
MSSNDDNDEVRDALIRAGIILAGAVILDELFEVVQSPPRPVRTSILSDEFYVVDEGYPNVNGFLALYRGERYHRSDFRGRGGSSTKRELFNQRHSSIRNMIERCFGLLKARFPILKQMSNYKLARQSNMTIACCVIHNFIIKYQNSDSLIDEWSTTELNFDEDQDPSSSSSQ